MKKLYQAKTAKAAAAETGVLENWTGNYMNA